MSVMVEPGSAGELDVVDARRRLAAAAEDAKRLEERGDGFAALEAWKRYELIERAIAAHERRQRVRTAAR
jgi:hypothetical protein